MKKIFFIKIDIFSVASPLNLHKIINSMKAKKLTEITFALNKKSIICYFAKEHIFQNLCAFTF